MSSRRARARRVWEHRRVGDLVQIYATGDQMTAELTRARLEDEGIDVLVKNSMGGSSAYPVGPSYLFVPEEQVEGAKRVIAAIESGAYALPADEDVDAPDEA
jgi:hypothetical protein